MNRVACTLLALLSLPVFARAQSYPCEGALGTACRTTIHDGWYSEDGVSRASSVTSTLLVLPGACPQEDRIVDVDLEVQVLHPYVGDLEIVLTHPDGTAVSVLYRPGIGTIEGNCPNDDLDVWFDDDDGVKGFEQCRATIPALRGSLLPFNPMSLLDGKARNGTWTLTVRDHVSGNEGVLAGWKLDLPCVPDLPDVTLDTIDATVSERGPDDRAIVTLTRGGDPAAALDVAYLVTGSASLADFEPLPGKIQIPAGAASASIEIHAADDTLDELDETIVVSLLPGAGYEIGARASAFVTLVERSGALAADGGPDRDAGGGASGRSGAGGRGGAGNTVGEPRDAGADGGDDVNDDDDGCSCRVAGRGADDFPFVSLGLVAFLLAARLQRRQRAPRV